MKYILTLIALFGVLTFSSCKKENEISKPQIADIEFEMYDLRATGDTTISEVIYPSTLILKSDYTWTIDLGGAKSNGTYSWTTTSNQQSAINFTILNWTDFTTNQILSDKLKSVLQTVNNCGYSIQNPSFANFLVNNFQGDYFASLRTKKK